MIPQVHLDHSGFCCCFRTVVASSLSLCLLTLQSYHFTRLSAGLHPLGGLVYEFGTGWRSLLVFICLLLLFWQSSDTLQHQYKGLPLLLSLSLSLACGILSLVVGITCRCDTGPGSQTSAQTANTLLYNSGSIMGRCYRSKKRNTLLHIYTLYICMYTVHTYIPQ